MTPILASFVASAALLAPIAQGSRPQLHVVRNVRLEPRPDAPEVTLVVRDGRIEGIVDSRAELPTGARELDASGRYAVPAFVDAYTRTGIETPAPTAERDMPLDPREDVLVDMREANRNGIQPSFSAARGLALSKEQRELWREHGFGALLAAPGGEVLAGSSALAVMRDAAPRDAVLLASVFDHAAFATSGDGYPSTLMGEIAQLRQFVLDAQRQVELVRRREAGASRPRPPFDLDLDAIRPALAGERRVMCEAESAADIERWLRLADELGFEIAIAGGREAWKVADVLAARGIPVVLTLEWGDEVAEAKEPKEPEAAQAGDADAGGDAQAADEPVWDYEEPLAVRRERRRLWEESRDCALRLSEAGVRFAFGSGRGDAKVLLERVRELVEAGLPADQARAALTATAADILGVQAELGRIELGRPATFALWTAPPLEKGARVAAIFVEGFPYEMDLDARLVLERPAKGVDVTGVWLFDFEGPTAQLASADLEMGADGKVTGTIEYIDPGESRGRIGRFTGQVSGSKLELDGKVQIGMFETEVAVEGRVEGDELKGEMTWRWSEGADTTKFTARREPKDDTGQEPKQEQGR